MHLNEWIGVILLFISLILFIIGLILPYWQTWKFEVKGDLGTPKYSRYSRGLWRQELCENTGKCSNTSTKSSGDEKTCMGLGVASVVLLFISLLIIVFSKSRRNNLLGLGLLIVSLGIGWGFIGIYANEVKNRSNLIPINVLRANGMKRLQAGGFESKWGAAFILVCISTAITFTGGILLINKGECNEINYLNNVE